MEHVKNARKATMSARMVNAKSCHLIAHSVTITTNVPNVKKATNWINLVSVSLLIVPKSTRMENVLNANMVTN